MNITAAHHDISSRVMLRAFLSVLALCACLLLLPSFANALSLEDAKAQGLVGEESNGYLGAVQGRPDVETLVQSVNNQRKQKYADIAKKNGTTLVAVEVLAGKKAVENTAPGQYIRTGSGWSKK